jgi:hypothetical protein
MKNLKLIGGTLIESLLKAKLIQKKNSLIIAENILNDPYISFYNSATFPKFILLFPCYFFFFSNYSKIIENFCKMIKSIYTCITDRFSIFCKVASEDIKNIYYAFKFVIYDEFFASK